MTGMLAITAVPAGGMPGALVDRSFSALPAVSSALTVMLGRDPSIRTDTGVSTTRGPFHPSQKARVKIIPVRVRGHDQVDFPIPHPMLDRFLPPDRAGDFVVPLGINQAFETIPPGKATYDPSAVFTNPANDIAGHTDIQRTKSLVGDNVDPSTFHSVMMPSGWLINCEVGEGFAAPGDVRVKREHDGGTASAIAPGPAHHMAPSEVRPASCRRMAHTSTAVLPLTQAESPDTPTVVGHHTRTTALPHTPATPQPRRPAAAWPNPSSSGMTGGSGPAHALPTSGRQAMGRSETDPPVKPEDDGEATPDDDGEWAPGDDGEWTPGDDRGQMPESDVGARLAESYHDRQHDDRDISPSPLLMTTADGGRPRSA